MTVDPYIFEIAPSFGVRDDRRGLLIITDDGFVDDANAVADAAGLRLLDTVSLDSASERLDMQVGCDVIMLACPRPSATLERLIVQLETIAIQNDLAVILVAGIDTLDLAYACLRNPRTQLLCAPDDTDIAAALLAAAHSAPAGRALHDAARDGEGVRLRQLSDEVGRLARTLDALTHRTRGAMPSFDLGTAVVSDRPSDYIGLPADIQDFKDAKNGQEPAVTAARVRDLLRARRLRAEFLPGDLFADPAWDMLLDLLAAQLDHERVSVSSLCIAAAVPPTTALRWIRTLTDKGLVERQADPHDGRRIFIALTHDTAQQIIAWFGASRRFLCG